MSNSDVNSEKEIGEVEKEINLETSVDQEGIEKDEDNVDIKIEKKSVKQLTKEERDFIITNAKNGIENEYFDVKILKNGNARIVAKKSKTPTVSQKVIKNNNEGKVYLSNDQLLMEHVMELQLQLTKLQGKHKKLKKKYYNLRNDIYEDVDDSPVMNSVNEKNECVELNSKNDKQQMNDTEIKNENIKPNVNNQRGWRSRVTYL